MYPANSNWGEPSKNKWGLSHIHFADAACRMSLGAQQCVCAIVHMAKGELGIARLGDELAMHPFPWR